MAKILIIGTGGVGTIAGLSLTQHGNEVTFVVRSNFEELKKTGYNIESCDHGDQTNWKPHRMVNSVQEAIANDKNYDYVLVAMKALPDVFSTADIIRPVVESSPNVAIVLFQNGLNIEEPIVKAFPNNVCVSGVSMIGSTNLGAGEIHQAEPDYVKIGYFDNGSDKAPGEASQGICPGLWTQICSLRRRCGLPPMAKAAVQRYLQHHLFHYTNGLRSTVAQWSV